MAIHLSIAQKWHTPVRYSQAQSTIWSPPEAFWLGNYYITRDLPFSHHWVFTIYFTTREASRWFPNHFGMRPVFSRQCIWLARLNYVAVGPCWYKSYLSGVYGLSQYILSGEVILKCPPTSNWTIQEGDASSNLTYRSFFVMIVTIVICCCCCCCCCCDWLNWCSCSCFSDVRTSYLLPLGSVVGTRMILRCVRKFKMMCVRTTKSGIISGWDIRSG
jgi:hypothetical protein